MSGSVEETREQLEMIETALRADPGNSDLLSLKTDLVTLLELMGADPGGGTATEHKDDGEAVINDYSEELRLLEGKKVRAAVSENDDTEHGEAVIISAEPGQNNVSDINDVYVRLVFSHPTVERLVPCKYYLDGRCRRSDEECRWSHGEVRRLGDLVQHDDHESDGQVQEGSQVLARGAGGVWSRATVKEIVGDEYLVQHDVGAADPCVKTLEELYLIDDSEKFTSHTVDTDLGDSLSETFVPQEIGSSGVKFGEWEHFTRGLGSRLMIKMGWTPGSGLGQRSEGRVEPVSARMYPLGKSLDWCMEMRDKYGDNIGVDVEVIMKREAREALKRSRQVADAEERRDNSAKSLFDFINVSLSSGSSSSARAEKNKNIKQETDENLKLRQFQMSEQVARLEKEISKLKDSYNRHKHKDPVTASTIKSKIDQKTSELLRLQSTSKSLSNEAGSRKSKSKLSIF